MLKFNLALAFLRKKNYRDSLVQLDQLSETDDYKARAFELKIRIQQIICDWSSFETTKSILYSNQLIVHPFLHISHIDNEEKLFEMQWNGQAILRVKIKLCISKQIELKLN